MQQFVSYQQAKGGGPMSHGSAQGSEKSVRGTYLI